jgi:hypothetical protein
MIRQGFEHATLGNRAALATVDHRGEFGLQASQHRDLPFDIRQMLARDHVGLRAGLVPSLAQADELFDRIQ